MTRLSKCITLGLVTGVLGLIIGLLPFGLSLEEHIGLDLLFTLRGPRQPPNDVVIISLDKQSADFLGFSDDYRKWPRRLHAQLIEVLHHEGAAVIVFDILFDESRSPDDDKALSAAIQEAGNVVLCCFLKTERMTIAAERGTSTRVVQTVELVPPIRPFYDTSAAIAPFPIPKIPYKVSQYWTFKQDAGDAPTLPVVAFQIYSMDAYTDFIGLIKKVNQTQISYALPDHPKASHPQDIDRFIRETRGIFFQDQAIGESILKELDRSGLVRDSPTLYRKVKSLIRMYRSPPSLYFNFYGPPQTVTTIPYYQVLQNYGKGLKPPGSISLKDKAVFVGHSPRFQHEQKEMFFTVFSQSSGLDLSGVEIAATGFANLLEDVHIEPPSIAVLGALLFFWGAGIGIVSRILPVIPSISAVIGLSIAYLVIVFNLFTRTGLWYPLVVPLFVQSPLAMLGAFLWTFIEENKERRNIGKALEYYLPNDLVDKLTKNISAFNLPRQLVYGICLWTDAEQYTALSEQMNPQELADFMNRYFQILFDPVKKHGGVISNVVGDSVLAVWVAPQPNAELRKQACSAALDITDAIIRFSQSADLLLLPTRIGIHSGHILLGNVGAIDHYEYRPIGDIVNTATRIEGINKFLKTRILASSEVVYQVEGIITREIGSFMPVGKSTALNLHELIGRFNDVTPAQIDGCAIFASALKSFRARLWQEATEKFLESIKCFSRDGVSDFYLDLCRLYQQNPPGDSWDGVIHLERK
ncbi:MAG: adenylate/guanylate cyclase with Chase sensor [Deltaproteobacteria bacterium]|nr:adenylate/guanylate cyclase with Chase sensor [Deltaproteobacteria bacterium]